MKICMFVYKSFKNDARIEKEAKSLLAAGYSVTVVGVLDKTTKPYEEKDGIRIIRVSQYPIQYGIMRAWRSAWLSFKETVRESSIGDALKPIWYALTQQTGNVYVDQENSQENGKPIVVAKPVEQIPANSRHSNTVIKRTLRSELLLFYRLLFF